MKQLLYGAAALLWFVVVFYLSFRLTFPGDAVAARIEAKGGDVETVAGDVTDDAISARMLDVAERRFDRFDAVFANAGYGSTRPVADETARRRFERDLHRLGRPSNELHVLYVGHHPVAVEPHIVVAV